jgi:hypothetical protein
VPEFLPGHWQPNIDIFNPTIDVAMRALATPYISHGPFGEGLVFLSWVPGQEAGLWDGLKI